MSTSEGDKLPIQMQPFKANMKLMLLVWIIAVPAQTFVLQTTVNLTLDQDKDEQRFDLMKALNLRRQKEAIEVKTRGRDKRNEEDERPGMLVEDFQGLRVDSPERSLLSKLAAKNDQQQSAINQNTFLPITTSNPPPSSLFTAPASTFELLSVITNRSQSPEVIPESQNLLTAKVSAFLWNRTSSNGDLLALNTSKLHLKEDLSIKVTAAEAKASRGTPKNKATGSKRQDKKMTRTKKDKLKTEIMTKPKKLKPGKKPAPTTPPYFPYFQDHYCPPECSCYGRVVQCSDKHLEKIPYGIPHNTRYILLMNNNIDSIQTNLLSQYDAMEFLVLRKNRLTDNATQGAFLGIQNLKRLYIERNLLESIPNGLPDTLEELRLDWNRIRAMSDAAFRHCPHLLILSLSNNSLGNTLSAIPPGVLLPLGKLRTLTLSYNQLVSIPLQLPLSLRELYLRGNRIQGLHRDLFWGEAELQILDLSLNRLTDKGLGKAALLNASRLESLNLEGNFLKQVPRHLPSTIKTLNLERNFISSISKDVFISMPQLENLGLARNKITNVAVGTFRVLPILHQLDMSHNGLQQVPRQLPLWLHSATFTNNKIRSVPRDAFCLEQGGETPLSRLVVVHLEYNSIDRAHLDPLAYRCLRGVQVLQFY